MEPADQQTLPEQLQYGYGAPHFFLLPVMLKLHNGLSRSLGAS
jgi:hypothetical protein